MPKAKIININAKDFDTPEMEEQFNQWYEAHAAETSKFKGMRKMERYRRIGDNKNAPRYLAIYHFDSIEDFNAYQKSTELAAAAKVPGKPDPDAVKQRFRVQYELLESKEK